VYNNLSVATGKGAHAFKVFGWPNDASGGNGGWPTGTEVFNNIFIARDGATALYVDDFATSQGNAWDHNVYHREGGTGPLVRWGGRENGPKFWDGDGKAGTFPPTDYADLESFRKATGQEAHGLEADPKIAGAGAGAYGRLPLPGAKPAQDSPALGAGRDPGITPEWLAARRKHLTETGAEAWGIPMDPAPDERDYWGEKLGRKPSIGPGK
jgi:hypothetical protein